MPEKIAYTKEEPGSRSDIRDYKDTFCTVAIAGWYSRRLSNDDSLSAARATESVKSQNSEHAFSIIRWKRRNIHIKRE